MEASTDFASFVGEPVSAVDTIFGTGIDYNVQLEQLGGFSCNWTNGGESGTTEESSVSIRVLPKADYKWTRYIDVYEYKNPYYYCFDYEKSNPKFFCGYIALINEAWIEFYLDGNDHKGVVGDKAVKEEMRPMFDALAGEVKNASQVNSAWTAPEGTSAIPTECKKFVAANTVAKATGTKDLDTYTYRDGPQVGMTLDNKSEPLVKSCSFSFKNSDYGVGGLDALPGGEWAFDEYVTASPSVEPVELSNLPEEDSAYLTCTETSCGIDFSVGGNWISVYIVNYGEEVVADLEGAVTKVADVVAKNLV